MTHSVSNKRKVETENRFWFNLAFLQLRLNVFLFIESFIVSLAFDIVRFVNELKILAYMLKTKSTQMMFVAESRNTNKMVSTCKSHQTCKS